MYNKLTGIAKAENFLKYHMRCSLAASKTTQLHRPLLNPTSFLLRSSFAIFRFISQNITVVNKRKTTLRAHQTDLIHAELFPAGLALDGREGAVVELALGHVEHLREGELAARVHQQVQVGDKHSLSVLLNHTRKHMLHLVIILLRFYSVYMYNHACTCI